MAKPQRVAMVKVQSNMRFTVLLSATLNLERRRGRAVAREKRLVPKRAGAIAIHEKARTRYDRAGEAAHDGIYAGDGDLRQEVLWKEMLPLARASRF
jgi:hypothetical protein